MQKILFRAYLVLLFLLCGLRGGLYAVSATLIGDTVVDAQALTLSGGSWGIIANGGSFQQDAVITHNGWQYVAYYNGARHVCVARRQLPSGAWGKIELTDYHFGSNNGHNTISMGICPNDGTIHLSFDHHGSPLHYRISQAGAATHPAAITWDESLFYGTRNYLESGRTVSGVTYPRFWQTPDGHLQMYYRSGGSGNGDSMLVDYDAADGKWKNTRMVISRSGSYSDPCGSSTSRNAYLNYPCYGPDGRLHWTWCWRESSGGTNHDICHAWSDDGGYTWYNTLAGQQKIKVGTASQVLLDLSWTGLASGVIADHAAGLKMTVDTSATTVVPMTAEYGLMNQQGQAVDPQGRVHTVMYYNSTPVGCGSWTANAYHHYWRDTDGTWNHVQLPLARGSRPKLFFQSNGDLFMIYTRSDRLNVAAASAAAAWTDWKVLYTSPSGVNYIGEGLGDFYRFGDDGILSVMVQIRPSTAGASTPLHILDFELN